MNIMKLMNKNKLRCGIICLLLCMVSISAFGQEDLSVDFGILQTGGPNPYKIFTLPVIPSENTIHTYFSIQKDMEVGLGFYNFKGFSFTIKIFERYGQRREVPVDNNGAFYYSKLSEGSYEASINCLYVGDLIDNYTAYHLAITNELSLGEYPYEPIEREDSEKEPSYGSYPNPGITSSRSYLREKTMLSEDGKNSIEKISYFDGLGRPVQTVLRDYTPSYADFADFTDYNSRGLKWRQWLPAPLNNTDGAFVNVLPYMTKTAMNDKSPYLKTIYERSSLNRVAYTCGAGTDFTDKRACIDYFNNQTDSLNCLRYENLTQNGYYPKGTLEVERRTDEDGNISYIFTDRMGRVILERHMNGTIPYDTYYVYSPGGDLSYVFPPMKDSDLSYYHIDRYAYQYRYDDLHRLIEKKLPGCESIHYRYDNADRVVFQQDGNLRAQGKWMFSLADSFGREAVSGMCVMSGASSMNTLAKATFDINGGVEGSGYTFSGVSVPNPRISTINYYDTYDFLQLASVSSHADSLSYVSVESYGKRYENTACPAVSTKGKLTGTRTYSPETNEEIITAYYYDDKGNIVQKCSTNLLGGYNRDSFAYTFTGKLLRRMHSHSLIGGGLITEYYTYAYDHAERFLSVTHQIGNGAVITLSENEYDMLCRLKSSRYHNGTTNLNYSYNVRGWLTGIHSDKFMQAVHYAGGPGIPRFNGNISSMEWKAASDSLMRGYCFDYDGVNRLTSAVYGEGDSLKMHRNRFDEQVTGYDKEGNILGLLRSGAISDTDYGVVDSLSMKYDGNQLISVSDNVADSICVDGFGFKDGSDLEIEYFYDSNGNLTKDLNKKIAVIEYNYLNLPSKIQFENGDSISYVYSGEGTKLRTIHVIKGIASTTDYCGNAIYENGVLKLLLTEYGYITLSDTVYHYFLQDHQGNNRVVIDQNGTVEEVNHYYPFGGVFARSGDIQPYKYNGKELDRKNGLDWYDYGARMYDAALGRFIKPDRYAEKYVSISPYQYGANNPVNNIDINGDSIAVLNLGSGKNQHLAILVQNSGGEWQYFSVNGDNVFSSGKHKGGRTFDDLGEKSFSSPEEFINSEYNKEGSKEDKDIANYHFSSAYVMPTTKEQDEAIRDEFIRISKKEEYSLNVFSPNHCATTVQRSLQKAGIETRDDLFVPVNSGIGQAIRMRSNPYLPSDAYRAIKQNNQKGYEIKIK